MKKILVALLSLLTLLALTGNQASAASFTINPTPVVVSVSTTFDASALACSPGPCSYTWQWYFISGGRAVVGGQMGFTPTIRYTFDTFAASKPYIIVSLTIGQGRVGPRQTYQQYVSVLAA